MDEFLFKLRWLKIKLRNGSLFSCEIQLVRSAFQYSVQIAVEDEKTQETKVNLENDLRTIVKEGKEKGLSAYASLKRAGIIKQIREVV